MKQSPPFMVFVLLVFCTIGLKMEHWFWSFTGPTLEQLPTALQTTSVAALPWRLDVALGLVTVSLLGILVLGIAFAVLSIAATKTLVDHLSGGPPDLKAS